MTRLTTERLILRPWEDRDRAPMAAIQGDAEVRRFFPKTLSPLEADAEIDLAIARARENGFHFQAAELKQGGELVGLVGLGIVPDAVQAAIPSRPRVEIGWTIAPRFWGRGLVPEAARAWLAHAWSLGLDEVVAFTARINQPSRRVMEKIGMVHEPADSFAHPNVAPDHPIAPHVLYRACRPASGTGAGTGAAPSDASGDRRESQG